MDAKPAAFPGRQTPGKHPSLQLEDAKKQLAELREKLARTPDTFPLLKEQRRAKVKKMESEIRLRYGMGLEEPHQNPAEIAKQAIKAVKDGGTHANASERHPGLQLEDAKKELEKAKKDLRETPETMVVLHKLRERIVQNLENQIRAQFGVEEGPLPGVGVISRPPIPPALKVPAVRQRPPSHAGITAYFGVVPVTEDLRRKLMMIREGFDRARSQAVKMKKRGLAENISAFEATYTKDYLERWRIPQAIELARRALYNGWQVIIMSDTASKDPLRKEASAETETSAYQQLDAALGGKLSEIIPPFPDVYDSLQQAFGDEIGDYSGRDNSMTEQERVRADFLSGVTPMLYSTYAVSGVGLSLHDEQGDRPTVSMFLGPPLSGVLLERAVRLVWGSDVKSDIHAVFLVTDSESDIRLMREKVGPRLRALGATVLGERDSLASAISTYTSEERVWAQQEALAYAGGNKFQVDTASYTGRRKLRPVGINDWSEINFPSAETAKHKWMNTDKQISGEALSARYLLEFGAEPTSSGNETVDADGNGVVSDNGLTDALSVQNLDPPGQEIPLGVASVAPDEKFGHDHEAAKNTDQKAMFFLATSIAILAFLITHNAPAGWFKDIHQWWVSDFVSLASVFGLTLAASMMLVVLYPGQIGFGRSKVWFTKDWILRCGFWVGTVAAFLSLLFLILSKKPHHTTYHLY